MDQKEFEQIVTQEVPDWAAIFEDENFLAWLPGKHSLRGAYFDILLDAIGRCDSIDVVWVFGQYKKPMKLEDALKTFSPKIKVTVRAPGEQKYRISESGHRVKIFESITRDATPEDIVSYDERKGTLVSIDGKKYSLY